MGKHSFERAYPNILKTLEGVTVSYENTTHHKDERQRILQTTYVPLLSKK